MSDNREIAIKLNNVKKMYRLGQIGGGTLQADLQSWWARKRGKEDPNVKIGQEDRARLVGQTFMALNGIDLTIYKGEAVGIIGSNGAGKSTMLKLLSRVTAPTTGEIDIYGRITSMLEVGTGFSGEMTGRENVYMNGAILGMTKAEIDAKMEQIIEFSEVRDFIDTPVKRYSSGMYVKLAFSVAAHLDSEIMIMDEVLAVGDMAFQKKCLDKMRDAAKQDGRTVLYVSHNMNTIRQLCDRCVVLDKGKVIFDGDVEKAISIYLSETNRVFSNSLFYEYASYERESWLPSERDIEILSLELLDKETVLYDGKEKIHCLIKLHSKKVLTKVGIRFEFNTLSAIRCGANVMSYADLIDVSENADFSFECEMDISELCNDNYYATLVAYRCNDYGHNDDIDCIRNAFSFTVENPKSDFIWSGSKLGYVRFKDIEIKG